MAILFATRINKVFIAIQSNISISFFLFGRCLLARDLLTESPCNSVRKPTHAQRTENVLEGRERVVDTEENRRDLEVDKEHNYSKIQQAVWGRDHVRLLVQDEQDTSRDASLRWAKLGNIEIQLVSRKERV